MVEIALTGILVIVYVILSVFRYFQTNQKTTPLSVMNDWWRIFRKCWKMPEAWDGDSIYEKLVYWLVGIPLLFIVVLLFGRLIVLVK